MLTIAYVKGAYIDGRKDMMLNPENTDKVQIYTITNEKGEKIDLKYWGY